MHDRKSDVYNKTIAAVVEYPGLIDQWGNGLQLIGKELKYLYIPKKPTKKTYI